MNFSEFIGFAGLILAIVTGIIFPFVQRPIVIYDVGPTMKVSNHTHLEEFIIKIRNSGMGQATHILTSLSGYNIKFLNFSSQPFLSKHFVVGKGNETNNDILFEIDTLAPQSQVVVTTRFDNSKFKPDSPISIDVIYDQSVGYTVLQLNTIVISYLTFAIMASLFFLYIYRIYHPFQLRKKKKHIPNWRKMIKAII